MLLRSMRIPLTVRMRVVCAVRPDPTQRTSSHPDSGKDRKGTLDHRVKFEGPVADAAVDGNGHAEAGGREIDDEGKQPEPSP